MANVRMERVISLDLNKREFLLVTKALRGKLREEEREEALALQESLFAQRHAALEHELHESEKVIVNIQKKREDESA